MSNKNEVNFKTFVVFVGAFHLGFVGYILYETIRNIQYAQEPIQMQELNYIVAHLLFQLLLIITLIVGAIKEIHYLMLPWLSTTFILFFLMSLYTILIVVKEFKQHNPLDLFITMMFSGALWIVWYTVFQYYVVIKRVKTSRKTILYLHETKVPLV